MVKLIVTDVDDTIVPEGTMDLNPEYFEVIRKLQAKGIIFAAASGRQKVSIKKVFAPIQDEIMYLADNGTDIETKDFAYSMKLEDGLYPRLAESLDILADQGFAYMSSMPDWTFINEKEEAFYQVVCGYGCQVKKAADLKTLPNISKVSLYHPAGIPKEIEESLKAQWSDCMDVSIAGAFYLDFTGKGCNKGKGLKFLQEHYGIDYEETVSFGNADNDISMIQGAKYGYAVGNASENLKKAAYEIIAPMKEDAVLNKLKEILAEIE